MQIHDTAIVSPDAKIGTDVVVGPFTQIHAECEIGSGTVIGSHCELGHPAPDGYGPLVIGKNSLIRSHSTFYAGSQLGEELRTGHSVTVREGTTAGVNLQLGSLDDIQGDCQIGDYVRFHSNVHVGKLTTIESFVWVFPYVVFTNDPHPPSDGYHKGAYVESYAAIATMSTILPGVRIGSRSLVGAQSLVNRDVPADSVVAGVPARVRGLAKDIQLSDDSGPAYPWMRHFHRGYPQAVVEQWQADYQ